MIAWVIAGLLGMATGLRIGWVLVHKQSPVSTGMIVALGSLALVSALNWEPLTILVDSSLGWPNISVALSQAAFDGLRGRQLRDDHEHVRQPYRGGQQAMGALAVSGRHRDWRRKPRGVLLPWPAA